MVESEDMMMGQWLTSRLLIWCFWEWTSLALRAPFPVRIFCNTLLLYYREENMHIMFGKLLNMHNIFGKLLNMHNIFGKLPRLVCPAWDCGGQCLRWGCCHLWTRVKYIPKLECVSLLMQTSSFDLISNVGCAGSWRTVNQPLEGGR